MFVLGYWSSERLCRTTVIRTMQKECGKKEMPKVQKSTIKIILERGGILKGMLLPAEPNDVNVHP